MAKRITCIIAAFVMAVTVFYVSATPASAASTVTYQQATATAFGTAREKTGTYYIWVDAYEDDYTGETTYRLARMKNKPSGGIDSTYKCLKKLTSYSTYMDTTFVSNGYYVYYALINSYTGYGTIYRTNVKSGGVKTIKKIYGLNQVEGYYNGRVYYTVNPDPDSYCVDSLNLRSCKIKTKKTRLEKKNFDPTSSYGRYFTGTRFRLDVSNVTNYRYNASSRTTITLQSAYTSVITSTGIYYLKLNGWDNDYIITKSNWKGKNRKTIKKVYDVYPEFFGKRRAIFDNVYTDDYDTEVIYKTGKVNKLLW